MDGTCPYANKMKKPRDFTESKVGGGREPVLGEGKRARLIVLVNKFVEGSLHNTKIPTFPEASLGSRT